MALKKIERRHPGTKLSLRSHAVAIGTMFLLLAACGDDGSSNGPSNNGSSESDIMAVTFDDLPVCTAKREGVVAYVKDEKTAYICVDSDWTADSEDDKSSSNEKDATSSSSSVIKSSSSSSTDSSKTSSSDSEVSSSSSLKTASSSSVLSSSSWSSEGTIGSSSSIDLVQSSSSVKNESSSSVTLSSSSSDISVVEESSSSIALENSSSSLMSSSSVIPSSSEESSSSIDLVQSSSSVKDESSSSVIPGTDPESSSSSFELSCSALLEGTDGWSWDIPKKCRFNSDIAYGTLTDKRDNQTYKTIKIGDQTWMAENLNYADSVKTPSLLKRSWCFNKVAANCAVAGRLYTWAAAIDSVRLATDAENPQDCGYGKTCTLPATVQGICPDGWHLPTRAEWNTLFTEVGGQSTAAKILKSQTGWYNNGNGTDGVGFSALPAGRRFNGKFDEDGDCASFWGAFEFSLGNSAYRVYLYYNLKDARSLNDNKLDGGSVRCLQDQQ